MSDSSLPLSVEFKDDIEFPKDRFIPASDKNYDRTFLVRTTSTEQITEIRFVGIDGKKIIFFFNADGKIGIKGQFLFYNLTHLVFVDTVCKDTSDGRHIWEPFFQSGEFNLKECTMCGHTRNFSRS